MGVSQDHVIVKMFINKINYFWVLNAQMLKKNHLKNTYIPEELDNEN